MKITMVIFEQAGKPQWDTGEGKLIGLAYNQAAQWTLHPETFPYFESNQGKLLGTDLMLILKFLLDIMILMQEKQSLKTVNWEWTDSTYSRYTKKSIVN